jgi:glycogen operon protein
MFRMGDEFLQTQHGNNNAYNQDNETSWLDWSRLEANQDIFRFFKLMIAFRKANPSIARSTFWRDDIRWYGADSEPDLSLGSRSLAYCLRGSSIGAPDLYVMINSGKKTVRFNIQEGQQGQWLRIVDTALPSPEDIREAADAPIHPNEYYQVKPHSIVVLRERS